ncbi:MAG: ATP-binding cassette domain-containing protein, partial [Bacteroidales bacterium]
LIWDAPVTPSDSEITTILTRVNALHLANRFAQRLETPIVNYTHTFSAGERQRLALARVLLRKPELLLLDEATSALDAQNEQQIMQLLTKIKEDVTILFVTHRTTLQPYFDHIIDFSNQPQNPTP